MLKFATMHIQFFKKNDKIIGTKQEKAVSNSKLSD